MMMMMMMIHNRFIDCTDYISATIV